ncbi:ABC transporter permease [Pseudobacter ginsenosidimutans]|uniref:Putative ABC transport system permease protein n=1 Tax=Pseudobacter ginsenosidimutans TaxID=661488 RepID=A0A4Q7MUE2_9BACT|nr:ABC transporter permease [Pseudobacter ginsenosidimutans]QEC40988.1 FtsX-like permease family protein [Pseudobacter ginsenosidimutans]RZS72267.1 putative ABC transport system permease protein [Pseudobacter ginsenosidimutans]
MFRNYFKTAWRNLSRNKTATLINITGLMIGMTCCLLIGLYAWHEMSYDNFHEKKDRIARVIMAYQFSGEKGNKGDFTSTKVLPTFQRNFPEVESGARMMLNNGIITVGDKQFEESKILFADSSMLKVFSFRLLKGNPEHALSGLFKMVLSASTAKKYFGDQNPVGQIVKFGARAQPFEITGIVEDCPSNSQIKYDMIASFSSKQQNQEQTYFNANYTTYLLFKDPSGIASLQEKLPAFMKEETKNMSNTTINFFLEPFKDIHLYSEYDAMEPNTSINYIYIIGSVALLILAIACFTYINLSTARSMERAKEVGIRKVVGAEKSQIFRQFLSESVILSSIALILSFGLAILLLPVFNHLSDRQLEPRLLFSPFVIGMCFFAIICIGVLAGSYPAIVLSAFQPVRVLKGAFKSTSSGALLRKSLIVFQFSISAFLIIATFIIQKQLHFIQNKKLGYEREHVLVLPYDDNVRKNLSTIRTEFKSHPDILNVSRTSNAPTQINSGYNMRSASMPETEQISVNAVIIDEEYIKTTGIQIIAGEDLNQQDMLDVASMEPDAKRYYHFILNESAAATMGWTPQEAIGKLFWLDESRPGIVKAVVKDFNFQSMHTPIKPLVLFPEPWARQLLVKVSGKNIEQALEHMEAKWKQLVPTRPFNYHFLDEDFDKLYRSEIRLGKVINVFAGIAISLACLGLFGLSSYTTQQRIKEIGVRRVIGASVFNIVFLLSKDFVKFVIISFAIATPMAWWIMSNWLQDYAYAIKMPVWVFALAAVLIIIITLITISFQSIRAALMNPVKSLRSE